MVDEVEEVDIVVIDGKDGAGAISDEDLGSVGGWRVRVIIEEVGEVLCREEGCCKIVIEIGHWVFKIEGFGSFVDEEVVEGFGVSGEVGGEVRVIIEEGEEVGVKVDDIGDDIGIIFVEGDDFVKFELGEGIRDEGDDILIHDHIFVEIVVIVLVDKGVEGRVVEEDSITDCLGVISGVDDRVNYGVIEVGLEGGGG